MESQCLDNHYGKTWDVIAANGDPKVLLLCEHASNRIPAFLNDLGLDQDTRNSHIAWDPGALNVAKNLLEPLSAKLVSCEISRLVYDCNRPPEAASAIPDRSELYDIPGNKDLDAVDRAERIENVYTPFIEAVAKEIRCDRRSLELLVTIHSFTPVYHGRNRNVELGILHGRDDRFALAMMDRLTGKAPYVIRLNEPYAARDGVTHSLDLHGTDNGLLNVMIEIRNDLIQTQQQQHEMAEFLAPWIIETADHLQDKGMA